MKNFNIYLFVCLLFTMFACQSEVGNVDGQETFEIAELLDRSEKIQLGSEWDYVQNFYQERQLSIKKNADAHQEMLELAELFIKEARVTGEHGHYYPAALELTNYIISNTKSSDLVFQALVTKAGVQLSLHEFEEALVTGKKALAINKTSAQVYGVLVDCYVELGDYKKAVAMADQMISIKPDIRSYSRVSYLREIHGDLPGAEEALRLAVNSGFPGYEETAWAMLTLSELYIDQKQYDKAENVLDQILATRKDYPFAIAAKAEIAYQKNELQKAEDLLNEAIDIIPEVGFYVQLAQIYKDQNRTGELPSLMTEIFLMLEDDVAAGHNMNLEYAQIYIDLQNDYDQAHEYAQREWIKRPSNVDVNRLMAEISILKDNKEEAKKYVELASVIYSDNPKIKVLNSAL